MQIHGTKADGTSGALDGDETRDWIIGKVYGDATPGVKYKQNAGRCATDFLSHNGSTSGGGTDFTHNNRIVFHRSNGALEGIGCTIFFICADEAAGVGKIVAAGYHVGAHAYNFEWVDPRWTNSPFRVGAVVEL
ncbi:MAG: hypothetical protein KC486_06365 [Myxococcales bacterium]|nr:hypothetical protein [Myxococcales bacterium]